MPDKTANETTTLSGRVEKIIYKAPESGFTICTLNPTSRESFTAQGVAPDLAAGEIVSLTGSWKNHTKWGRQFHFDSYDKELPKDANGIEKFLGSGVVRGIGPSFAKKLVAAFGSQTLEIIDKDPERLMTIPGVGPKRVESLIASWEEQREVARVMVFLRGKDISPHFASKIYKLYGAESIEKLTENPYRLVEEIWGVGFKSADSLAIKLGIGKESVNRAKAGISHLLSEAMSSGHMALPDSDLRESSEKLLEFNEEQRPLIDQAFIELEQEKKIKKILKKEILFWARAQCFHTEVRSAHLLKLFVSRSAPLSLDLSAIYHQLRTDTKDGISLNEQQIAGVMSVLEKKVTVITGGPGTGKTTLVKKLIATLEQAKVTTRLAAPTGRAAKRMFESTGHATETIHRLLEFTPGAFSFARNQSNTLTVDVLIVDEASMIDSFLFLSLLKALPADARLVLLGDVDQLPSVGPGNILRDLINSGIVAVTRLTEIFRQAQDSMIVVNAHKINKGEFPSARGAKKDFFVLRKKPEEALAALRHLYTKTLPQLGIKPEESMVLPPMNRGIIGTQRINSELQALLNPASPEKPEISRFGTIYRLNDRVMQIKNNYTKFVFNGDLGTITKIDKPNQKLGITFGEKEHEYELHELSEITLAYAISIHKSQGSEFKAVIVPIAMQHFVLLQRNLIYTAVTRAKQLCIMMGEPRAIGFALRNATGGERHTFFKEYLHEKPPFDLELDQLFGGGLDTGSLFE